MNTPWRAAIDRALDANRELPEARYLQLATIRGNGRPANRTLVFRGFRAGTAQLRFTTDVRSAKVEQILRTSWAEACWFFPQTREQFRLLGTLTLVGEMCSDGALAGERSAVWRELPDASRQAFAGPAPGAARAEDAAFALPASDPQTLPATFGLLLLEVVEVDHLELAVLPHRRYCLRRKKGAWSERNLNP